MTFLPIVDRELRVAARRPATHRVRLFAAMAVIGIGFVTLASAPSGAPPHQVGKTIFAMEAVVAFAFCLLSGVFLTADCLSVEKREGTLGLLFLTDLRGFDVVLGKLTATSVQSVYGILAIFPMLGLPLLMGGVSRGEFARVMLALLLALALSLTVGMFLSAIVRDTRQSMAGTFGVLVFLAGVLPALAWLEHVFVGGGTVVGKWFLASPVGALLLSFDWSYRTSRGGGMYWSSIAILSAFSIGALILAGRLLPRSFLEQKSDPLRERGPSAERRMRFRGGRGFRGRRARLERNPFYWLAARDRFARALAGTAIVLLGLLWLGFVGRALKTGTRGGESFGVSFFVAFALHLIFKGMVALEASRRLSEDHQSGALELVLVTPLPPRLILRGQWLALRGHFFKPIAALVLVNLSLLFLAALPGSPLNIGGRDREVFVTIFAGGALLLLVDFWALSWVGMLMALRSKTHTRAVLSTLGRVMLLPWAGLFGFVTAGLVGRNVSVETVQTFVLFWILAGVMTSCTAATTAKRQLRNHFRTFASGVKHEPPRESPSGFWLWLRAALKPGVL